jgi:hypothetical protein
MKVRFLKPAQLEVDDAVAWYDSHRGQKAAFALFSFCIL